MKHIYLFLVAFLCCSNGLFAQSNASSTIPSSAEKFVAGDPPPVNSDYLVSDFENLILEPDSYWDGSDGSGSFTSGAVTFGNNNSGWGWTGWAYSNISDNTTPGYNNQYSAITGAGFDTTNTGMNYGVAYISTDWDTYQPLPLPLSFSDKQSHAIEGLYLTNSTYAALSMEHGDDFAKKFGGEDGNDPDYLKILVWGVKDGLKTDTIEYYLADYRFEDNSKDYIVKTWQWLDLSSLGKVDTLLFSTASSDVGDFGINTPTYFNIDNIYVVPNSTRYISEVLEYQPAPGQFINKTPWGLPSSKESLVGKITGSLSLGAFGGYVIFKFENPVKNHPDNPYGVDFTIFGNPSGSWSEPGIVWVMKDENENGLPDDTWYELAGSDYFFSSTLKNYQISYANPKMETAADVFWSDNLGNTGYIRKNEAHSQPYYPLPENFGSTLSDSLTLKGSRIDNAVDKNNPTFIKSYPRAFGYADNQLRGNTRITLPDNPYTAEIENSGGDAFDIHWAVNKTGDYVDLDAIHFIKVQTAVLADSGWIGEISTEITGAIAVAPDPSIDGVSEMIVIKDLPDTIKGKSFQIEAFPYKKGRWQKNQIITWSSNLADAKVDADNLLTFSASGELTLTAQLPNNPEITNTVSTYLQFDDTATSIPQQNLAEIKVYPNPASENIFVEGADDATIEIFSINGYPVFRQEECENKQAVSIGHLPQGIYIVKISGINANAALRFLKK